MKKNNSLTEYSTSTLRHSTKKGGTQVYLTWKQKSELMAECGDASLILFEYYLSRAGYMDKTDKGFNYRDDSKPAKVLGWTTSKVEKTRQRLMKNNWMKIQTGRFSNNKKIVRTTLGKDLVLKENKIDEISITSVSSDLIDGDEI